MKIYKKDITKMKKLLALLLFTVSFTASAQHFHHHNNWHHRYYYGGSNGGWVAPLIIGGVVGAAIANRPTQPETVIIRQPIFTEQTCTAWKEIQANDGTIYRERTCTSIQK
jgi:cytochrome bd-type quinol oxidase subunit 2